MEIEKALFTDLPEIAVLQKLAFYAVGVFHHNFKLHPFLATLADFEKTYSDYLYTSDVKLANFCSVSGKKTNFYIANGDLSLRMKQK